LQAGAENVTEIAEQLEALPPTLVGAPGTLVLLLPWPVFMQMAPDAWPNKPLTAVSFIDI
jgi:hypothetical protein